MSPATILDNEYATLFFHDDKKIVHHKVKKYIHGDTLRQLLMKGYDTLKAKSAKKWLSDDALNGPLLKEDAEWAQNDWFPKVVKAGWQFWAIVLPVQVIGQMNMKKFMEGYAKAGVTVNVFSDADKALAWLAAQ